VLNLICDRGEVKDEGERLEGDEMSLKRIKCRREKEKELMGCLSDGTSC